MTGGLALIVIDYIQLMSAMLEEKIEQRKFQKLLVL